MLSKIKTQSGFTLIEVIVVIALLTILATIVLVAINPTENSKDARNVKRKNDVLQILNAVNQFYVKEGNLPGNLGTIPESQVADIKTDDSVGNVEAVICSDIVPTYIASLPFDTGGSFSSCAAAYDTKYRITRLPGNRIKVAVAGGEGLGIEATR